MLVGTTWKKGKQENCIGSMWITKHTRHLDEYSCSKGK